MRGAWLLLLLAPGIARADILRPHVVDVPLGVAAPVQVTQVASSVQAEPELPAHCQPSGDRAVGTDAVGRFHASRTFVCTAPLTLDDVRFGDDALALGDAFVRGTWPDGRQEVALRSRLPIQAAERLADAPLPWRPDLVAAWLALFALAGDRRWAWTALLGGWAGLLPGVAAVAAGVAGAVLVWLWMAWSSRPVLSQRWGGAVSGVLAAACWSEAPAGWPLTVLVVLAVHGVDRSEGVRRRGLVLGTIGVLCGLRLLGL